MNQRQKYFLAFGQINAEYAYGIQRVRFPNRTVFIQSIDALGNRIYQGVCTYLDFTIKI